MEKRFSNNNTLSYILQDSFWDMVEEEKDLVMCKICGREFESEEELKKHEPRCAFSRQQYSLSNEDVENYK